MGVFVTVLRCFGLFSDVLACLMCSSFSGLFKLFKIVEVLSCCFELFSAVLSCLSRLYGSSCFRLFPVDQVGLAC